MHEVSAPGEQANRILDESLANNPFVFASSQVRDGYMHGVLRNRPTYQGIGDTFVAIFNDGPYRTEMLHQVPETEDIDGYTERDTALTKAIFVDGHFAAGISTNGIAHVHAFQEEGLRSITDILDQFQASTERLTSLYAHGIEPIFMPTDDFSLKAETTDRIRHVSGLVLSKLLEKNPDYIRQLDWEKPRAERIAHLLAPRFRVNLRGEEFLLSDIVYDTEERPAALLYSEELVYPTMYYRSRSHGVWRALLAMNAGGWFVKDMFHDESSADAPLELQKILSILLNHGSYHSDANTHSAHQRLFVPKFPPYATDKDQIVWVTQNQMQLSGISPAYMERTVDRWGESDERKLFRSGYRPDFSKELDWWGMRTEMYGRLLVRVYPSRNGKVHYAVNEAHDTADGQVQRWIGTAAVANAKITNLGLADGWVRLHDAVTKPPVDYVPTRSDQDRGTYDERRKGPSRFEHFVVRSMAASKGWRSRRAITNSLSEN